MVFYIFTVLCDDFSKKNHFNFPKLSINYTIIIHNPLPSKGFSRAFPYFKIGRIFVILLHGGSRFGARRGEAFGVGGKLG